MTDLPEIVDTNFGDDGQLTIDFSDGTTVTADRTTEEVEIEGQQIEVPWFELADVDLSEE